MTLTLVHFLTISITLFFIGLWGIVLNRRNIIIMLMSIELMLISVNFNFVVFSVFQDDIVGQIFSLFVLTVAAAESAIGLAILVVFFRLRGSIAVDQKFVMKG